MYIFRIGVSDFYFPVITSRYLVDKLDDYQLQEYYYRLANFISDILEAVTAYTTIYLFYIYIRKHLRNTQKSMIIQQPNYNLKKSIS